jgi:Zn-dependent M28 family amino/carboxypeptidase
MTYRNASFLTLLLALVVPPLAARAEVPFDGKSWWHTVSVLADDRFEGRNTGSPGERRAEEYLVGELKRAHVAPAGSDGYYQPVQFRTREIDESASSLALVRDGKPEPLVLGEDAMFSTRSPLAATLDAPLVFVGYGLDVPETGYNDLAGLDLRGKVAVYISGSPADVPAALSAHYQSRAERWRVAKAAGAVGFIGIPNPASMDVPWGRMALSRTQASMYLADPAFDESAGKQFDATFNPARADLLFAGTGHDFAELAALARDRKPLPRFPLGVALHATATTPSHAVMSANLVARIPGSDPKLREEYVVLTAHLDHLGVAAPINGDRIYNGAMDNGSGSALLLDLARAFERARHRPKRSLLFVWVTAEEKGLLGSRYFAVRPTVPKAALVADINVDMFLPIIPLKVLTVYGLAESDLGDDARRVAARFGLEVQPDPEPLRNVFVRSDQYSFVREGVPSLMVDVGVTPGTPDAETVTRWLHERYHAPSDDAEQPVNLATAARFENVIRALVAEVADDPARPAWKPDSFFRRYAPPAAR